MLLLLLEALGAGLLFIAIIWWTMFAGRPKGELPSQLQDGEQEPAASPAKPDADAHTPGS